MPSENGLNFRNLTFNISIYSKENNPRNALRKGFGPLKSHPVISALIVKEITLEMP